MRRNTWWVEFKWSYSLQDPETGEWYDENDHDARRFQCLKKEIPMFVKQYVEDYLKDDNYCVLRIQITDKYITTDTEL